jgi:hypothetical protein
MLRVAGIGFLEACLRAENLRRRICQRELVSITGPIRVFYKKKRPSQWREKVLKVNILLPWKRVVRKGTEVKYRNVKVVKMR